MIRSFFFIHLLLFRNSFPLFVHLRSTFLEAQQAVNYTTRSPLGVAGLITPWNLPLYLLTWKVFKASEFYIYIYVYVTFYLCNHFLCRYQYIFSLFISHAQDDINAEKDRDTKATRVRRVFFMHYPTIRLHLHLRRAIPWWPSLVK